MENCVVEMSLAENNPENGDLQDSPFSYEYNIFLIPTLMSILNVLKKQDQDKHS